MSQSDVGRTIEWTLLFVRLPGREPMAAGVIVVDRESDELFVRLRAELEGEAPEETAEVWGELAEELLERSREQGGTHILNWLETTASHFLEIGVRTGMESSNPRETLDWLYEQHVTKDCADAELRRRAAF